jgi:ParB family chromosome partitioning protein
VGAPLSDASASRKSAISAERPIESIRVEGRTRLDMGDIDRLAASIADIGLLNDITIDETGKLLAGARRLAACQRLGLKRVSVKIVKCDGGAS